MTPRASICPRRSRSSSRRLTAGAEPQRRSAAPTPGWRARQILGSGFRPWCPPLSVYVCILPIPAAPRLWSGGFAVAPLDRRARQLDHSWRRIRLSSRASARPHGDRVVCRGQVGCAPRAHARASESCRLLEHPRDVWRSRRATARTSRFFSAQSHRERECRAISDDVALLGVACDGRPASLALHRQPASVRLCPRPGAQKAR